MPSPLARDSVIEVFATARVSQISSPELRSWQHERYEMTAIYEPRSPTPRQISRTKIHNLVMIAYHSRFYHVVLTIPGLTGYLYRGKDWDPASGRTSQVTIERVAQPSFCEMRNCSEFACWRISYETQTVEFCSRHTLSTMRDTRLWLRK
jgi:hypothetical protein